MPSELPRVLFVVGTRPEAIKLSPIVTEAARYDDWELRICTTGQHPELLRQTLAELGLWSDLRLALHRTGRTVRALLGDLVPPVVAALRRVAPSVVVGQGDTTSVLATALACDHLRIDFVHVEAGLRTGDLRCPFPEELLRVRIGMLASLHLAPTRRAAAALLAEGIAPERIAVTGNTAVDAVRTRLANTSRVPTIPTLAGLLRYDSMILFTAHRREGLLGTGLREVATGLRTLAARHRDTAIVWPVHPNPAVGRIAQTLADVDNIHLLPPLGHEQMLWLLRRAHFLITDSGGLQEEAPELGKPVLVIRPRTERMETVEQGSAIVVGHDRAALRHHAERWLSDPTAYRAAIPRQNPYGDGQAAIRCVAAIRAHLSLSTQRSTERRGAASAICSRRGGCGRGEDCCDRDESRDDDAAPFDVPGEHEPCQLGGSVMSGVAGPSRR